jgi:pyruvate/2-oxoglutarate dehydrogenase complex dihydrolipoamide acyltransferase (E2) component
MTTFTARRGSRGPEAQVRRVAWARRLVVDAGAAGHHRHAIHALFEADVTDLRALTAAHRADTGEQLSFTAFVVAAVARAIAADRGVHGYRDLRGRLVIFDDVDVHVPIEVAALGEPLGIVHVIRRADKRSAYDIHGEIRRVAADPGTSTAAGAARSARFFVLLPPAFRVAALRLVHRLPRRQKRLLGTVGVTAVGMFGGRGGWGLTFQLHTVQVVVGGIARRPALRDDALVEREYLSLTVGFDHDIVDGAPAARFVDRLGGLLESPVRHHLIP